MYVYAVAEERQRPVVRRNVNEYFLTHVFVARHSAVRSSLSNKNNTVTGFRAWGPAEIFPEEGGKTTNTLKREYVFGVPYKKSTIVRRA